MLLIIFRQYTRTLPVVNYSIALKSDHHPVVFLFRHGERCDRSENPCLNERAGITVNGADKARRLGEVFKTYISDFSLYSSDTMRTIQTATYFAGFAPDVDKSLSECDARIYKRINYLLEHSDGLPIVIFTHNHCLSYLAEGMAGKKIKVDYLDGLVLHQDKGTLYLDGLLSPVR